MELLKKKRSDLSKLFWPIFWEMLFGNLIGVADVAMVSTLGDSAVGSVGASGTYLSMINTAMMIVSVGAQAVMSRQIGAGKAKDARRGMQIGLLFNSLLGLIFSGTFFFGAHDIHVFLKTSPSLLEGAATYLRIVGSSCVLLAAAYVLSAYLRSFGKARETMIADTVGNLSNLALNALFLSLGYGIAGVATATLLSRAITLVLMLLFSVRIRIDEASGRELSDRQILKETLVIGAPAAGESLYWSACTAFVMFLLNQMDREGLAVQTYSYIGQISAIVCVLTSSFQGSSSIIVGWRIGEKNPDGANAVVMRAMKLGCTWILGITLALIPLGRPILRLLTDNEQILAVVPIIMAIEVVREVTRNINNVVGSALKTAGDAVSTLVIAIVIMPATALIGSYLLGIVCGLGAIGAFIGFALDEGIRGVLMFIRWRSRKWEIKSHLREKEVLR